MDIIVAASDFLRTGLLRGVNINNLEADEFVVNCEDEIKRFLRASGIKYQKDEIRRITLKIYREMKN